MSLFVFVFNRMGKHQLAIIIYLALLILVPTLAFLSTVAFGQEILLILTISPVASLVAGVFLQNRSLTLLTALCCLILPLGMLIYLQHNLQEIVALGVMLLAILLVYMGISELYQIIYKERHHNLLKSNAELKREIEERLLTEDQLKMFRFLVNNSIEGISITGPDSNIIYANSALHKMHGYLATSQEMLGFTDMHFTDPGFLENLQAVLDAIVVDHPYTGEVFRKRKDGSLFLCKFICYPLGLSGQPRLMASIIRDITKERQIAIVEAERQAELLWLNQKLKQEIAERQTAEALLSYEKQRTEAILNNIDDVVLLMSMDTTIQASNRRMCVNLGYLEADVLGTKLFGYVVEDSWSALGEYLCEILSGKFHEHIEVTVMHKDGRMLAYELSLNLISDNEQEDIVCTLRDLSAKQLLIEDLRAVAASQKALVDLKTRIISTVSHEYRTPLAVIKSSTDLLSLYYERLTPSQRQKHIQKIQAQIVRMVDLLNDVIEINRLETVGSRVEPTWVILDSLCLEIIDDYRRIYPQHQLEFQVSGQSIPIYADPKLLRQIISNLLSNASKYSPVGSCIQVDLKFKPMDIRLLFKDEGIGIPKEDLDNLFSPFHRASNAENIQGTGLGLAIVKHAIDAHGGTIAVESQVGKGSQFVIHIPTFASEGKDSKSRHLGENS